MKTAIVVASALACCGGPKSTNTPTLTLEKGTASLHVTVAGVRSTEGIVDCGLFNSADGFPGASPIVGGSIQNEASGDSVECFYDALPAGHYAVSVIHDENDNGQLDKNVLGIPTEGHGATNNVTHPTSPPTFDEAQITLTDGQAVTTTVNLKY